MKVENSLMRIGQLVAFEKREIGSIYFYAILSGLVQLTLPLGVQTIIGFVMGASISTSIYVLIAMVILGVMVVGLLQINQMKIIEKIQQRIFTRMAFDFAEKVPHLDLLKLDRYHLPEKMNRFFEILTIQKGFSKLLLDIPIATIQILFGVILLSFYHPIFLVFGIVLLSILWMIFSLTSKKGLQTSLKESDFKYEVAFWLQEISLSIKSFKFKPGSYLNLTRADKGISQYLFARTGHFRVLLFQYKVLVVFKVLVTMALLTIGVYLLIEQQLNIGEFIAAELVILTVIAAVEKLIVRLDSIYDVVTGLEKIASVTELPIENMGNIAFDADKLDIKLVDFGFDYPNGLKILSDINLEIPSGSKVCITGKKGSGKSTLLKLFCGYYSEFEGGFYINNIAINEYDKQTIRSKSGVYFNKPEVFTGTLLENISMGNTDINSKNIQELAEKTGLSELFDGYIPMGDIKITASGKHLSGSQKKQLGLLRALSNEPKLLLLQEPLDCIDDDKKHRLIQYITGVAQKATVIMTSNDEELIKNCDIVINLNKGNLTTIIKNRK